MNTLRIYWRRYARRQMDWRFYAETQLLRRALIEVLKGKKDSDWFVRRSLRVLKVPHKLMPLTMLEQFMIVMFALMVIAQAVTHIILKLIL